jgi:hypothetical protein
LGALKKARREADEVARQCYAQDLAPAVTKDATAHRESLDQDKKHLVLSSFTHNIPMAAHPVSRSFEIFKDGDFIL